MRLNTLQLSLNNKYTVLSRAMDNILCCDLNNEKGLREVTVKIGLEKVDIQEGVIVKALLDSRATELVMSSEFSRKQGFKLKKIERSIYVRNVDGFFKKKAPLNIW